MFGEVSDELVTRVQRWLHATRTKYRTHVSSGTALAQEAWDAMSGDDKDMVVKRLAVRTQRTHDEKEKANAANAANRVSRYRGVYWSLKNANWCV